MCDGQDVSIECATCGRPEKESPTGKCRRCEFNKQIRAYFHKHHPGLLKIAKENIRDRIGEQLWRAEDDKHVAAQVEQFFDYEHGEVY